MNKKELHLYSIPHLWRYLSIVAQIEASCFKNERQFSIALIMSGKWMEAL